MIRDFSLVGIDLGTSGIRVDVYDEKGSLLGAGEVHFEEQSPKVWLDSLLRCFPRDFTRSREVALSVDSTSGSFLLVDEKGNEISRPIMYYEAAVNEFDEIRRAESVKVMESKGFKLSPTSPLPKILKFKRENPELFKRVRWILPPATWLLYKIRFEEGKRWEELSVDFSNALKFGVDISSGEPRWFKEIFEEIGLDQDLFPRVASCGEFAGEAESEVAGRLGVKGAELYHGMTDGTAAALASGTLEEGDFSIYSGSTTVPKYASTKVKPHPSIYYHKHPLKGYLAGAASSATGSMLRWLAEKVLGVPMEEAFSQASRPDAEGGFLFFPPGDRSPFDDPLMGAALVNLRPQAGDRRETIGKVFRSAILGVSLLEYCFVELFEDLFGRGIEEVRLSGGGTRNSFWNLLRASVYEREVKIYGERVTLGVLIPVVLRLGLCEDVKEIDNRFLKIEEIVKPRRDLTEKYKRIRDDFMRKWRKLQEFYHEGMKALV